MSYEKAQIKFKTKVFSIYGFDGIDPIDRDKYIKSMINAPICRNGVVVGIITEANTIDNECGGYIFDQSLVTEFDQDFNKICSIEIVGDNKL